MILFPRLHNPRISSTLYEIEMDKRIRDEQTLRMNIQQYQLQLELKRHASILADSLHQLKGVSNSEDINKLENEINAVFTEYLNTNSFKTNRLNNLYTLVQNNVSSKKFEKVISLLNVGVSTVAIASCLGVAAFGAVMTTGTIGLAILGVSLVLVCAAIALLALYTLSVDIKHISNKQLKDIGNSIQFLTSYLSAVKDINASIDAENSSQNSSLTPGGATVSYQ